MTTPIERVRAALERADVMIYGSHHDNEQLKTALACIKEALSELKGKVLVPVEPTHEMEMAGENCVNTGLYWHLDMYRAMIAPYVASVTKRKGE